jgi:vacuolar-type H+-ATPase subunit H
VGTPIDRIYEKAKRIVREALSKDNFVDQATRTAEKAESHLLTLLDNQISSCYAAAITEQTNQLFECCKEIERLNKEKAFFQQLKKKAIQVYSSVNKL